MGETKEGAPESHYEIRASLNAMQNVREIMGYIAFVQGQPQNALKVSNAIDATIQRISLTPKAFRELKELPTVSKMYRRAVCLSWSMVFRIRKNEVLILGIVHAARRGKLKS